MGKYNLEKCNLKIKIWNLLVLSTDTVEIWKCLLTYVVVDPLGAVCSAQIFDNNDKKDIFESNDGEEQY